jgi:hypothetical protein
VGIFGRDRELDLVGGLLRRATTGNGAVCLLAGEAGIGKTRILSATRDEAQRRGMRVFVGRCRETEGTPAYWPWQHILQGIQNEGTTLPTSARSFLSLSDEDSSAADSLSGSRIVAWEALAEFVRTAARDVPIAILIDDLHRAGAESALLFEFVAERAGEARLFLAAAYRSAELDRDPTKRACLARTVRSASPLALELRGLSVEDVRAFLRAQASPAPPTNLAERVHELSGGNPFFLNLLMPFWGSLNSSWDARQIARQLPSTIRGSIENQLAATSRECRDFLELASVIGRVVSLPTIAAALGRSIGQVDNELQEACSAGLITDPPALSPSFAFIHDLVREVIYENLPAVSRSNLHLAVARGLEALNQSNETERIAEIAHHYAHAIHSGGAERALEYAIRAADSDLRNLAYEGAREHLARAVMLMDEMRLGDMHMLCDALVDLGRAEINAGGDATAWVAFERASAVARDLGRSEPQVKIALIMTGSFHGVRVGYDPRLVSLLEELLSQTDPAQPAVRALLLSRLILTLCWFPDHSRRSALSREAHELVGHVADARVHASVAVARYLGAEHPGDLNERLLLSREAVRLCDAARDLEMKQYAHVECIMASLEAGRTDEVREHIRGLREVVRRLRSRHGDALSVPFAHMGLLAQIEGRIDDIEDISDEVSALGDGTSGGLAEMIADSNRAIARLERSRPEEATDMARKWVTRIPTSGVWQCFLTMSMARTDGFNEAVARLRAWREGRFRLQPDWQWLGCTALLAEACAVLREPESAAALYEILAPYRERCVVAGAATNFFGSVERHLGLLAGVTGHHAPADEHFERAHKVHSRIGARLMLAHSLCDHVLLLERAPELSRTERAAELRAHASDLANEIGSVYLQRLLAGLR